MPYIESLYREVLEDGRGPRNPGQLNYQFTRLIIRYIEGQGLSYQTINDIVGALEGAKDEFRRRVVHRYEDQKIAANGDVYPRGVLGFCSSPNCGPCPGHPPLPGHVQQKEETQHDSSTN